MHGVVARTTLDAPAKEALVDQVVASPSDHRDDDSRIEVVGRGNRTRACHLGAAASPAAAAGSSYEDEHVILIRKSVFLDLEVSVLGLAGAADLNVYPFR